MGVVLLLQGGLVAAIMLWAVAGVTLLAFMLWRQQVGHVFWFQHSTYRRIHVIQCTCGRFLGSRMLACMMRRQQVGGDPQGGRAEAGVDCFVGKGDIQGSMGGGGGGLRVLGWRESIRTAANCG